MNKKDLNLLISIAIGILILFLAPSVVDVISAKLYKLELRRRRRRALNAWR